MQNLNLMAIVAKLGLSRSYFFQQELKTRPQSPDLNPIENCWHMSYFIKTQAYRGFKRGMGKNRYKLHQIQND